MALAAARSSGDRTNYERILGEATTEPARSLVLIDTTIRLLLELVKERTGEADEANEDVVPLLALSLARKGLLEER